MSDETPPDDTPLPPIAPTYAWGGARQQAGSPARPLVVGRKREVPVEDDEEEV